MKNDFKLDFINKYSEAEYLEVCKLIDKMFDTDSDSFDQSDYLWSLSLSIEKHNALQFTYYVNLSKEAGKYDEEVNITYENGINNGTEIIDYDLGGGGGIPLFRSVEVLDDIKPDWVRILKGKNVSENRKAQMMLVFNCHKKRIIESLHKQNYDNYVTGGGIHAIDDYCRNIKDKLEHHGFYWINVYKTIEADVNLV